MSSRASTLGEPHRGLPRKSSFTTNKAPVGGMSKLTVKQHGKRKPTKSKVDTGIASKETSTKKGKPQFDKNVTKKFDDMIDGDLSDLPPLPKTMVKIFLSSTFSDMRHERNILAREVYPYLRAYCASLGLDFQVVDMRWGITDDSVNDHSVENLCLLEVANCQKSSIGPNFIVLSGQRYGFRPIPVEIKVERFELLQGIAKQLNLKGREILNEWYKLDDNMVPPMYILQPIKTKFTFYGDYSPGCDDLRKKASADWWDTLEAIRGVIRQAANMAFKKKMITEEDLHQYLLSVTECEIEDGILKAENTDAHCLVYTRHLKSLDSTGINDSEASRFIDVIKTERDGRFNSVKEEEVEQLRLSLRDKIEKCLPKSNIKDYCVHWMPKGVDPAIDEHSFYLRNFCADFIEDCMKLIEKASMEKQAKIDIRNYYTYYDETIHHLQFCVSKCESFCGQEKVLNAAKSYILNKTGRKPFVIHAGSGLGKTSIMAMIMKSIPEWLDNQSHFRLIRFLGTTPMTNDIFDVLYTVLGQLSDAYDQIMPPHYYSSMKKMVECIPGYLRHISKVAKEPVIILLDSVDQLFSYNNAYAMEWLPLLLPVNIKIIVSTLPNEHGILKNLKKLLPDPDCFIEVPNLNEPTAKLIVDTYMKHCGRTLQPFQENLLLSVFRVNQNPLFLKLLLDEAKMWSSYMNKEELELPETVKAAISKLFEKLECKFGYKLVSHALGYITIGLTGLSAFEIEDVLSCDDEVLNEVYKYHDPPVPGIVRIPPVLWARIRYDIRSYLVDRMAQGKNTLYWYHRQFIETARERYISDDKDVLLHKNLATIYAQEEGVKCSIVLTNRKNLLVEDADRQVTPQPFTADNKRKLACLQHHTLGGYKLIGLDKAKSTVYCNFKFLCARIAGFSLSVVIKDLREFTDQVKDDEVQILLQFLTSIKSDLTQHTRFAFCLLAYIDPKEEHKHLKELNVQAREFLISKKKPMFIPEYAFLALRSDISSACLTTLKGFSNIASASSSGLLLRRQIDKSSDETSNAEDDITDTDYGVWNLGTFEVTDIDIPNIKEPLDHSLLASESLLYIHKNWLMEFNFTDNRSRKLDLSSVNNCDLSKGVVKLVADFAKGVAFVAVSDAIVHVDMIDWSIVGTYSITQKPVVIENIAVVKNGDKCLAVGKVTHSSQADQSQGPENQSFVSIFEAGEEGPAQFWTSDKKMDSERIALACDDQLLFVKAQSEWGEPNSNNVEEKEAKETEGNQLIICNLSDASDKMEELEITGSIVQLNGHPDKSKVIVQTHDGSVYNIYCIGSSSETLVEKINVDFAVNTMAVIWKKDIAFFSSLDGSMVLYNLESCCKMSSFIAHYANIQDVHILDQHLITLTENAEMKVWAIDALLQDCASEKSTFALLVKTEQLLDQTDVTAVACSANNEKIITCHECGVVKLWKMKTQEYMRAFTIQMSANTIHVISERIVAFHDTTQGMIIILDMISGEEAIQIPASITNIICSTMNSERDSIYLFSSPKQGKCQIDVVNVKLRKISKTIHLQGGLMYEDLSIFLSTNERYLVIRHKISEVEYSQIKSMWKKGGFSTQNHRYRFTALDLSQGTGALIPCNRQMSKIPTLGVFAHAYKGNIILIASRRYLLLWDIPTGRCDQKPSKERQIGMFYRPHYCGKDCAGANSYFVQSKDQTFLASGSEDGYMMVYNADSGIPRGKTKPSSKHNAGVEVIAISPDCQWIVSASKNNFLKLWDSSTGTEQFSVRLDAEIQCLGFSPNSDYVVFFTGTMATRVGIFSIPTGKEKAVDNS